MGMDFGTVVLDVFGYSFVFISQKGKVEKQTDLKTQITFFCISLP